MLVMQLFKLCLSRLQLLGESATPLPALLAGALCPAQLLPAIGQPRELGQQSYQVLSGAWCHILRS